MILLYIIFEVRKRNILSFAYPRASSIDGISFSEYFSGAFLTSLFSYTYMKYSLKLVKITS